MIAILDVLTAEYREPFNCLETEERDVGGGGGRILAGAVMVESDRGCQRINFLWKVSYPF